MNNSITDTYCENCGRLSHCGTNAEMKVNAHEVGIHSIVVCNTCRCKKCSKEKDTNNEL